MNIRTAIFCLVAIFVLPTGADSSAFSDFNQGIAAHNEDDDAEVIRFLSLALAASELPAHLRPAALLDRARAYARTKQDDLALKDLDTCVTLTPGDYVALTARGDLHMQRKEMDLARADFASAMHARPELPAPYIAHAETYMRERRFDEAVRDYNDGSAHANWMIGFYALRSEAYRLSARYPEAIKEADTAIAYDKTLEEAYLARARARDDAGDTKAALTDYDKARDLDDTDTQVFLLQGIALWKLGNYSDAARSFRRGPKDSASFFIWSWLADNRHRLDARDLSEKAAKITSNDWPSPIVKTILGSTAPEAALAAAAEGDAGARKVQTCEADFYIGEWQLARGNTAGAKALLSAAVAGCDVGASEIGAAKAELARML